MLFRLLLTNYDPSLTVTYVYNAYIINKMFISYTSTLVCISVSTLFHLNAFFYILRVLLRLETFNYIYRFHVSN